MSGRRDAWKLADTIVASLSGGLGNWTADSTYSLDSNLHNIGPALADLLTAGANTKSRRW